jgi:hypothetical protein
LNINAARRAAGFPELSMAELASHKEDIVRLACEYRWMQSYAGHEELRAKLAQLGQACDRYERLR